MTRPNEELNSLKWTRDFLASLIDPKRTPRVPGYIREEARRLLKHYPYQVRMEELYEKDLRDI